MSSSCTNGIINKNTPANLSTREGLHMSLGDLISSCHKEIAGSRTKNRLTIQISYAIRLIMDFYSTDFLVMMDYIEDVSVISDPDNPSAIHLYQIKTKSTDRQYLLSAVIKDEWFQKLYRNALKYSDYVDSASLVCNTDIVVSGTEVFPNERTGLDDKSIEENIKKIRKAIAKDQNVNEADIDLSKFFFVRSLLSTKNHKAEVEHEFQDFLLGQDANLQVATAKSIFTVLYDELDKRFNEEINEDCTDVQEIMSKKGLDGRTIKEIISCGLAIQIPAPEKLFSDFNVASISARRRYSSKYQQIKMDMYSNISVFVALKKTLLEFIESENQNGIDDMVGLFNAVYAKASDCDFVPTCYQDEYYLKTLIMILIYKYCYGGVGT